jgi:CheY-like chemotaxis protein
MKTILLIEDNLDDVFFMKRAIKQASITNPLQVIADGHSALEYLETTFFSDDVSPLAAPAMLLLDLDVPGKSGYEILRWIRSNPKLSGFKVIVMLTSLITPDKEVTSFLGADGFLLKPPSAQALLELRNSLQLNDLEIAKTQPMENPLNS